MLNTRTKTTERPLFSAALIVRDEETVLGECLASISDVVDEIIIADTGSRDRTKLVALEHGAKVFDVAWENDFSKARNAALDAAAGEWILYIDADERVRDIDREAVEAFLSDPSKAAHRVRFHPRPGFTAYYEYRIFRNDPRVRFTRVMHEKIIPGIERMCEEDGLEVGKCAFTIDHIGYEGEQSHKYARDLPLLKKQLEDMPNDIYNLRHVGTILEELGRSQEAAKYLRRAVELVRAQSLPSGSGLQAFGELLRWQERHETVDDDLLAEARRLFPKCPAIKWTDARVKMHKRDYAGAAGLLGELAAIDSLTVYGEQASYDRRIFDILAYESLGVCHFELGDYGRSAEWFGRAQREEPGRLDLQARLGVAEDRRGMPAD